MVRADRANSTTCHRVQRHEVQHFRAMDIDRFWDLIEQARLTAGPAADQAVRDFDEPDDDPDRDYWDFEDLDLQAALSINESVNGNGPGSVDGAASGHPSSAEAGGEEDEEDEEDEEYEDEEDEEEEDDVADPVALALLELLTQLPAEEIAAFDNIFEEQRFRAENDDIANAAVLIEHGFLGDDSFDDFRAGLVALGRSTFEAALADPDTLADHPLVREIAAANDPRWLGREDMLFVASHAYSAVTGEDEVTFYDFAEGLRGDEEEPDEDDQEVDEWSVTDEEETRRRLPQLAELFYEKSMRNRKRAMDKLGLQD
jgi:TATA-binding protein-associated factor Taf7